MDLSAEEVARRRGGRPRRSIEQLNDDAQVEEAVQSSDQEASAALDKQDAVQQPKPAISRKKRRVRRLTLLKHKKQ